MISAVIFSNTVWTFWDVMLLFFVWIPLLMLYFFCIFDIFRRADIGGGAKALWLVVVLVFPWIGTLVYLIARPSTPDAYGYDSVGSGTAAGSVPADGPVAAR